MHFVIHKPYVFSVSYVVQSKVVDNHIRYIRIHKKIFAERTTCTKAARKFTTSEIGVRLPRGMLYSTG